MTGPVLQNFAVPADDDVEVEVVLDSSLGLSSLEDCTIWWRAYAQQWGEPDPTQAAVVTKGTDVGGVTVPGSPPLTFYVHLSAADTAALLGNYYHEATVFDVQGDKTTVLRGLMTVTATENR